MVAILIASIDQQTGEALMRWTVRFSVLFYLLRLWTLLKTRPKIPTTAECWIWTAGWLGYAAHVVLAFHFVHQWSHADAWQHTASETDRMFGVHRGEGLWVNFAFSAWWLSDVVRIWSANRRQRRTDVGLDYFTQAFFAFIVFNATVVFGPAVYRWMSIPVLLALGWAWLQGRNSLQGAATADQ